MVKRLYQDSRDVDLFPSCTIVITGKTLIKLTLIWKQILQGGSGKPVYKIKEGGF